MLNEIKADMLKMIEVSADIGKYNQMLLQRSDICDTRNYNAENCEKIRLKLDELYEIYDFLKEKWFN